MPRLTYIGIHGHYVQYNHPCLTIVCSLKFSQICSTFNSTWSDLSYFMQVQTFAYSVLSKNISLWLSTTSQFTPSPHSHLVYITSAITCAPSHRLPLQSSVFPTDDLFSSSWLAAGIAGSPLGRTWCNSWSLGEAAAASPSCQETHPAAPLRHLVTSLCPK